MSTTPRSQSGEGPDELSADEKRMKPRSVDVTEGFQRAPSRAMLRAVGLTDEDWRKPQVGIASSWNEITPCNLSLDRLSAKAKEGVQAAGGVGLRFGTITVSSTQYFRPLYSPHRLRRHLHGTRRNARIVGFTGGHL